MDMNVTPKKKEKKERVVPITRQLATAAFAGKPSAFSTAFAGKKGDRSSLGYDEGDRVRHFKLGEGIVEKIADGGKDLEITVKFDKAGTKKMFAGFAKLKKI